MPREKQLDLEPLTDRLDELRDRYRVAEPFPHVVIKDFLPARTAESILREFPPPDATAWIQYKHYNENTLGRSDRQLIPVKINSLIDELCSPEFVAWLEALTGIEKLLPDPNLEGGGLHQTERNGFLRMHVDFSHHHRERSWRRRCNVIIYLNPEWRDEWGGALELWDSQLSHRVVRYAPLLNHALIFSTSETSYHGYPDPLRVPDGTTRKSIALYYYTIDSAGHAGHRATRYAAVPGDGLRRILIWIDNGAVAVYSRLKSYFGSPDLWISRVLRLFWRPPRR